ncbi:ferrochelatase [Oceanispirochaeta crateris]|uniref:Ferrochelatase n=1 Tax=Oceanispirochaeta crateris TaxID=2518645 RepID=A0A5C1QLM5_9SPIO|nr:ferrochelatase [Oceanispirochaeta crateris]QEN08963.1 ferrochelatase [Oceanispirochaeta crateris]
MINTEYDALLYLSFGGPEKSDDVLPFLRNVTRGKNIPDRILTRVAMKYELFGGKSPINECNRNVIDALKKELDIAGIKLPIYFGNRFWSPTIEDALLQMKANGVKKALAFVTSPYASYYGCWQYVHEIQTSLNRIGGGITIHKLKPFFNDSLFIRALSEILNSYLETASQLSRRIIFTAHNIPQDMINSERYVQELEESAKLVMEQISNKVPYTIAYQSKSRNTSNEWLSPELQDVIHESSISSFQEIIIMPFGFLSDHMEVIYDLDIEAAELAKSEGLKFSRLKTVGNSSTFISMIKRQIEEQMSTDLPSPPLNEEKVSCPNCQTPCDTL